MIQRTKGKNNANFKSNDFYKEYSNLVKEPLNKVKYSECRNAIYDEIVKELYKEGEYTFPQKFGKIQILKTKRKITYNKDGTINKINYKVDWKRTKDYWAEKYPGLTPEQLKEIKGKPKIYCDTEWRLSFNYIKRHAHYINKHFMWFIISRDASRGLKVFTDNHPEIDYKEK